MNIDPLIVVSTLSSWFPTFIGLSFFGRMNRVWQAVVLLFVFLFFAQIALWVIGIGYHMNNIWLDNIIFLVEGLVYMLVMSFWVENRLIQRLFVLATFLYLIIWITTFLTFPLTVSPITHILPRGLLMIVLSSTTLLVRSRKAEIQLMRDPVFLFATGLLLYNSIGSLIHAVYEMKDLASIPTRNLAWKIHSWVNITSNLIFAFALRCLKQKTRYSS
jgi:hypothetical protein